MLLDPTCPACGLTLRATDEVFGQVVRCPSCGGSFPVAPPDASEPDPTRAATVSRHRARAAFRPRPGP